MFGWLKSLVSVFKNDTMVMQFENMLIAEEAAKQAERVVAPVAPKRANSTKDKFVTDVKTTTETNEVWADDKIAAKKTTKPKKK
jgi:hypothetical protein